MKKTLAGAMIATLALILSQANPQPASAQVASSQVSVQAQLELIQVLLAQVMELQKMLLAMQGGVKPVATLPPTAVAPSVVVPQSAVAPVNNRVILESIETTFTRRGSYEINASGLNLHLVNRVEMWPQAVGSANALTARFSLTGRNSINIRIPDSLTNNSSDSVLLSLDMYDALGNRLILIPVEVKLRPVSVAPTPKVNVKAELLNRAGDSASTLNPISRVEFVFTVENFTSNLVMDVEMTVDCPPLPSGLIRNCRHYLFDLGAKAAESYVGVQADPFVKAGSSYRFTHMGGKNEMIYIRGYVDPGYDWSARNEFVPFPNSIEYRFILRDTTNGAEVWKQTYNLVNFKW